MQLRWPQGCQCPACSSPKAPWITARGYLHCQKCKTETSITSGTIFEKTRYPLRTWFYAVWLVTSQKFGANALGVKRTLGLGSYQTAWVWLHKLRRAMVRPGRDLLHGNVEIDETYVGGKKKGGKRGRGAECKEIVVIALEIHDPKGYGRVRMERIPDVSADSLIPFVCEMVKPGSVIQTDGWSGYSALTKHGYIHKQIVQSSSGDPAHVTMPGVHRIASLLKRVCYPLIRVQCEASILIIILMNTHFDLIVEHQDPEVCCFIDLWSKLLKQRLQLIGPLLMVPIPNKLLALSGYPLLWNYVAVPKKGDY